MVFYEVLAMRHTVRKFVTTPVEPEKIERILNAGLMAPSHNHLREWEFILLQDPSQRQRAVDLGAKARNMTDAKQLKVATQEMDDPLQQAMYRKSLPVQKRMLLTAPEVLVVCFRKRIPLEECQTYYDLNDFASAWACIENILLAMAAEGLFGVTYIPKETDSLKEVLEIPPDYEIATIIPFGYPAPYSIKQKPVHLRDKLHYNKWKGQP